MNKIKFLVFSIGMFTIISCDPESCVDYQLKNLTATKISIKPFKNGNNTFYEIESMSINTPLSNCGMGSSPAILFYTNDSIQIIIDNTVRKTYYPNGTGKNIFKTQDQNSWRLVESKKITVSLFLK